jgi:hypothetical protein
MERMERKMEQQLSKKHLELKYTVDVTNRFHNDIRRVTRLSFRKNGCMNTSKMRRRLTSKGRTS